MWDPSTLFTPEGGGTCSLTVALAVEMKMAAASLLRVDRGAAGGQSSMERGLRPGPATRSRHQGEADSIGLLRKDGGRVERGQAPPGSFVEPVNNVLGSHNKLHGAMRELTVSSRPS